MSDILDFRKYLQDKKIAIYGTGYIAEKFWAALKKNSMEKQVAYCIVTSLNEKRTWNNLQINDVGVLVEEKNILVCIAVHEAIKDEIIEQLIPYENVHYIWIYPFLTELYFGKPIEKKQSVEMTKILKTCIDDYRLIIRKLAIDNYFKKNQIGYDLYIRSQALHSSRETAKKRLIKFKALISLWEKNGYDEHSLISINENYEVIDGNHRLALAYYFKNKYINCTIFSGNVSVYDYHGKMAMLTEKALEKHFFTKEEINFLEYERKKMFDVI